MYKLKNLIFLLITITFTACSVSIPEYKTKFEYANTDYDKLISNLLRKASNQIFPNMKKDEVLLVSNFSELVTLNSNTKLSFILTDMLKTKLVSQYSYTIREVELSKQFRLGEEGFKILTRDADKINNTITKARYAVVGTYTLTKNQLLLFLKLIDIRNGSVLASSTQSTDLTQEIIDSNSITLDNRATNPNNIYQPMVL